MDQKSRVEYEKFGRPRHHSKDEMGGQDILRVSCNLGGRVSGEQNRRILRTGLEIFFMLGGGALVFGWGRERDVKRYPQFSDKGFGPPS